MINNVYSKLNDAIAKAEEALRNELSRLRTGRANASLVDGIRVDYYGTPTPLGQMAAITTPEPRMIMVKPWDRSVLHTVEKAIQAAGLGLNPSVDGEIIRIPVPALTADRRKELAKVVRKKGEETKVAIRNARRDANEALKKIETDGTAPKDDVAKALKKVQEVTDAGVANVDKTIEAKEKDISEI